MFGDDPRFATLSRISGIFRNMRKFAKKSEKCQENWQTFSNVRNMSGILYAMLSGDIAYFVFLFNVKKRVECKIKTQNILRTFIINVSHCRTSVLY